MNEPTQKRELPQFVQELIDDPDRMIDLCDSVGKLTIALLMMQVRDMRREQERVERLHQERLETHRKKIARLEAAVRQNDQTFKAFIEGDWQIMREWAKGIQKQQKERSDGNSQA